MAAEGDRASGTTDIEVVLDGWRHAIIEAKIGLGLPAAAQVDKYLSRLSSGTARRRRLVLLTERPLRPGEVAALAGAGHDPRLLEPLQWSRLLELAVQLVQKQPAAEGEMWLREFVRFLEGGYHMRGFTQEVWIAPASVKPLWPGGMSLYDTHVKGRIYYWDRRFTSNRPLYIAFRCRSKVEGIQRVLSVEHGVRPVKYIPDLRKARKEWAYTPNTVWHLGELVRLPKAIPTGDPHMRQMHLYCDMDVLLSSSSVKQIAEKMKARNAGEEADDRMTTAGAEA